jgi:hypothetical protein
MFDVGSTRRTWGSQAPKNDPVRNMSYASLPAAERKYVQASSAAATSRLAYFKASSRSYSICEIFKNDPCRIPAGKSIFSAASVHVLKSAVNQAP